MKKKAHAIFSSRSAIINQNATRIEKKLRYWVYILRPYPKHDDSDTYDAYLGSTTLYNSFIISIRYKIQILELILTNTYSVDKCHIFGLNQYLDPIPTQHKEGCLHKDLVQSHRRSYFKYRGLHRLSYNRTLTLKVKYSDFQR